MAARADRVYSLIIKLNPFSRSISLLLTISRDSRERLRKLEKAAPRTQSPRKYPHVFSRLDDRSTKYVFSFL